MNRLPPRTLLEKILQESDYTQEEWCSRFDQMARSLGEGATSSIRQLQRWASGQVSDARPASRRVAARLWGHPFGVLVSPVDASVVPFRTTEDAGTVAVPAEQGVSREPWCDWRLGKGHDQSQMQDELLSEISREVSTERFSAKVALSTAHEMSRVAAAHRRSYRDVPARHLLAASLAHLELVWSLRPPAQDERVRALLLRTVGESAALAGTLLLLDLGAVSRAMRFIDVAWVCARASEAVDLQAVVLGVRSFLMAYARKDHRAGLEMALQAGHLAVHGCSAETQAWVAAVTSERFASLGDADGCQRMLDASQARLDAIADHEDERWSGIGCFDASKHAAYEGGDLVRLGLYEAAEARLNLAIEGLEPGMQRHRCTALIDRAEARLGAREMHGAQVDGIAALEIVLQVEHVGNLRRIGALGERLVAGGVSAGLELQHEARAVIEEMG